MTTMQMFMFTQAKCKTSATDSVKSDFIVRRVHLFKLFKD